MGILQKFCSFNWKKKAVNRALEIRRLSKKILELQDSRDSWKNKATAIRQDKIKIENELLKVKEELKKN